MFWFLEICRLKKCLGFSSIVDFGKISFGEGCKEVGGSVNGEGME